MEDILLISLQAYEQPYTCLAIAFVSYRPHIYEQISWSHQQETREYTDVITHFAHV